MQSRHLLLLLPKYPCRRYIVAARSSTIRRTYSSFLSTAEDAEQILPLHPTWSLRDLFEKGSTGTEPEISEKELHHLLRLSALPSPKNLAEQQRMQRDLQSQLKFVKAIQEIDIPDSVKPLQSIRDETQDGMKEQEITVESLEDQFAKEEVVGIRGRIIRRQDSKIGAGEEKKWDPLALAPRTIGRYIAINTAKD
ncbi:MAG: hypothetical protein Q9209_005558 [Squamulea sp. 1 TL-2023]